VPSGSVISENPAAATQVNIGSAVNLVISTGPAQVQVPNVVGQTQAAATTAITGAGLVPGTVTTASSSTAPSGSVISENPAAATQVNIGSANGSVPTAWRTLLGIEAMDMIRKGRVRRAGKGDVVAQVKFISKLFGIA
jgi:hypothetical protein